MVTFNKVVSDLCIACGVEHDPTKRVTERRGLELIRECTEKVRMLTMGTAALATVLEEHLVEEGTLEGVDATTLDGSTVTAEVPVELTAEAELVTNEELPEVPTGADELADVPVVAPAFKAPKLGK